MTVPNNGVPACVEPFKDNPPLNKEPLVKAALSVAKKYPPYIVERFWAKVRVRGPDECWPWKHVTRGLVR